MAQPTSQDFVAWSAIRVCLRDRAARGVAAWLLLVMHLLPAQQTALSPRDPSNIEYRVKAAFLFNFTKFVEWPPDDPEVAGAPFAICVLGDDPVGTELDRIVEGESVGGRKLMVVKSKREVPKTCQILYVKKSGRTVPEVLMEAGRGVLTVGEGEGFLHDGGIMAFVLENHRIRFNINLTAARNASLKVSSKLLNVARTVEK